jgi:hypothetical protein
VSNDFHDEEEEDIPSEADSTEEAVAADNLQREEIERKKIEWLEGALELHQEALDDKKSPHQRQLRRSTSSDDDPDGEAAAYQQQLRRRYEYELT